MTKLPPAEPSRFASLKERPGRIFKASGREDGQDKRLRIAGERPRGERHKGIYTQQNNT